MNELMRRRRALMGQSKGSGYAHGTWEDLFYHIDKGDWVIAYSIGEILPLDLGAEGIVNAEIVAFNADTLQNSDSDKASVTFVTKNVLNTKQSWTTSGTPPVTWGLSTLRDYLQSTVKQLIPQSIRNRIVPVKKYTNIKASDGTITNNVETIDDIWLPSMREVGGTKETIGPQYGTAFGTSGTSTKRIKYLGSTAAIWWTRSYNSGTANIGIVGTGGKISYSTTSSTSVGRQYCAFGFCVN